MGNAIAIGLRKGLVDAGVPVDYDTELTDLRHRGRPRHRRHACSATASSASIRARRGVILGSGGFEKNLELREKYQPQPDVGRLDDRRAVQHRRRHPRRHRGRRRRPT